MERKIGLCIFIILCNITVSIISIATPYWIIIHVYDLSDITIDGYVGLWKGCSDFEDFTICKAVPKVEGWLKGVRALMIIGIILLGLSCLPAVVFARNASNHTCANICIFSLIIMGVLLMTALIVFAQHNNVKDVSFGYSFYLLIPVIILSLGTAIVLHQAKERQYTPIPSYVNL